VALSNLLFELFEVSRAAAVAARGGKKLLDRLTNNWSLKLLALAIALALWVFVVGQEKSEISVRVPVEVTNVPPDTLVVDDVVGEVDVRLHGPRTLIRRVAAERLSKAVDLTGLKVGVHVFQVEAEDLRLPPGCGCCASAPTPSPDPGPPPDPGGGGAAGAQGQTRPGLRAGRGGDAPVQGHGGRPREEVSELERVLTVPVDLTERKESFSQSVPLRSPKERNVRLGRSEVEMTVAVRPVPAPAPKPEEMGEDKRDAKGERPAKPARKKPVKPVKPKTPQSN